MQVTSQVWIHCKSFWNNSSFKCIHVKDVFFVQMSITVSFWFLPPIFCVSLIMYLPIKPQATVFPCNSFIFHHILMWKWTQDGRKTDAYCDMQTGHIERKSNSFFCYALKAFLISNMLRFLLFFTVYHVHFLLSCFLHSLKERLYWHWWFEN